MSVIGSNVLAGASGQAVGEYQIDRSLRFNDGDSPYLSKTFGSGTRKKWTWSTWLKRTSTNRFEILFGASGAPNVWIAFGGTTAGSAGDHLAVRLTDGSTNNYIYTDAVLRDPSAWYHVVINIDTDNGTEANRIKFYINGVLQTRNGTVTSGLNPTLNSNIAHSIGRNANSGDHFDGYLAEMHFVDAAALDGSSFAEEDSNGVWQPINCKDDLTYGTTGFYLDFSDNSSTSALGTDSSGNSNNFSVTGFSVASGAGNDSLLDSPTNYDDGTNIGGNYATLNPLSRSSTYLTNGNLELYNAGFGHLDAYSTIGLTSSKWYWEVTFTGDANAEPFMGISSVPPEGSAIGQVSGSIGRGKATKTYIGGTEDSSGGNISIGTGDTIGFALDLQNGTLQVYVNGTAESSQLASSLDLTKTWFPAGSIYGPDCQLKFNFGQRPFAISSVPTGHLGVCTQNFDDPLIANGSTAFDVFAETGTGASKVFTMPGGFGPDLVWAKSRTNSYNHALYDTVRGATKRLVANSTQAEDTQTQQVTAFSSTGFTYGTGNPNGSSEAGVFWAWDAGTSAASSNSDGDIVTNVKVSQTNGFSIATYTGNGSANQTLGHGLNAAPAFVLIKDRTSSQNWAVLHTSAGTLGTLDGGTNYKLLELNATAAARDASFNTIWHPTSTTVKIGEGASSAHWTNKSGDNYLMLAWAPVEGFSAFGSYTGTGTSDSSAPFIYTGMRPAWIMVKRVDGSGGNWTILDNARNTYNAADKLLFPNLTDSEATTTTNKVDITSNGFKLRGAGGNTNASGATYVWAAFASHPFKTARAR